MSYELQYIEDPGSLVNEYKAEKDRYDVESWYCASLAAVSLCIFFAGAVSPEVFLGGKTVGIIAIPSGLLLFCSFISAFLRSKKKKRKVPNLGELVTDKELHRLSSELEEFFRKHEDSVLKDVVQKISAANRKPTIFEERAISRYVYKAQRSDEKKTESEIALRAWERVAKNNT